MAFPWSSDVGTSSINEIQALARSSGISFTATSTYRPGDPGYHGSMNAVDMASSAQNMKDLAAYLYQYSAYLLELIHSNGDFFVKNGKRVDAAFYGAQTVSEHFDHVHCATTVSALRAASTGGDVIPANQTTATKPSRLGCLPTATIATLIMAITSIGGVIWNR